MSRATRGRVLPPPPTGATRSGRPDLNGYDGDYSGEVSVEAVERTSAATGACSGPASLSADHAASPAVTGSATCRFEDGPLRELILEIDLAWRGEFSDPPEVEGEVDSKIGHSTATGSWSGAFTEGEERAFGAAWSGEVWYFHHAVEYEAALHAGG